MSRRIKHTGVFTQLWETADQKKIHLLRGGARSSKSYSLMQMVFLWLMTGRIGQITHDRGIFSIVRNVLPALRQTVMRDFDNYLDIQGVRDFIDHRKTQNEYHFDDRMVSFFPATDESRLKGRQQDFVWINEANEITWFEFQQLIMRTSGQLWLDYNPDTPDSYVKSELEEKRLEKKGDVNLMISTVIQNPFLSDSQREEIEGLIDVDRELYEVYTLGKWVEFKGLIYPNWEIIEAKDFPKNSLKQCYGLDFGFNDPSALIHLAREDKTLYIDEVFYKSGMLTKNIINFLNTESGIRNDRIIGDSADPKAIAEIRKAGYRIRPCKKGADSIRKGIDTVKSFKLKITDRSINIMQELKRYKWKIDKEGNTLNEPIDKYNHAADAIRYGTEFLSKSNTLKIL